MAGSVTSCLGVLFVAWFLGFTFANSSLSVVSGQISGSAIERALLTIAPQPPAFLAKVQEFLQNNELPNPFSGLMPDAAARAAARPAPTPPGSGPPRRTSPG